MTIFGTETQALTQPLHCGVRFAPGDAVQVGGVHYRVVSQTETKSDEHDRVRVVTLTKSPSQRMAPRPLFTAGI